jgi:hypothetical protein
VTQRLDERPLAVDRLVQQFRRQAPGPFDGVAPETPEDVPRLAETGRVCRAHLGRSGHRQLSSASTSGPTSTPLIVTFSISP